MQKIKSIEGVKFGQIVEPWNTQKRYEVPVKKVNNDLPDQIKKKTVKKKLRNRSKHATFTNSIIGENL